MEDKFYKKTLKNGLTVLFQPVPTAASVSVGLWVKYGSRYENENEFGYTHFLEHMLFKGTINRTAKKQAEEIERVGGYVNAATSREYTYYYVTIMKTELNLALDILSDMIANPLLKETDIKNEINVVLEEMKSYQDSPDDLVYDFYYENFLQKSPLGRNIIGTKESVSGINEKSIRSFYKKNYTPDRMMLSVSGAFEFEEIVDLANKYFGILKNKESEKLKLVSPKNKFTINFKQRELEQVSFLLGSNGFPREFKTTILSSLSTTIFGGGMASRLFQRIREKKGLCYSVHNFTSSYLDAGINTISCATSKEKFLYCLDSILKEVKLLRDKGFTKKELNHAKSRRKGSMSIGYEIPEQKMINISVNEFYYKRYYTMEERINSIDSITLDEINDYLKHIYSCKNMHLSCIGDIPETTTKKVQTDL